MLYLQVNIDRFSSRGCPQVSNDVIGPVTDGPDADEDRANDEGMVEAGKGRWQNSKSLDKGKNKAKPKSRKGPRESKAGRVPTSDHDGEAARALFRLTARSQTRAVERIAELGVTRRLCKEISLLMEEEVMAYVVEAMLLGIFTKDSRNDIAASLKTLIGQHQETGKVQQGRRPWPCVASAGYQRVHKNRNPKNVC